MAALGIAGIVLGLAMGFLPAGEEELAALRVTVAGALLVVTGAGIVVGALVWHIGYDRGTWEVDVAEPGYATALAGGAAPICGAQLSGWAQTFEERLRGIDGLRGRLRQGKPVRDAIRERRGPAWEIDALGRRADDVCRTIREAYGLGPQWGWKVDRGLGDKLRKAVQKAREELRQTIQRLEIRRLRGIIEAALTDFEAAAKAAGSGTAGGEAVGGEGTAHPCEESAPNECLEVAVRELPERWDEVRLGIIGGVKEERTDEAEAGGRREQVIRGAGEDEVDEAGERGADRKRMLREAVVRVAERMQALEVVAREDELWHDKRDPARVALRCLLKRLREILADGGLLKFEPQKGEPVEPVWHIVVEEVEGSEEFANRVARCVCPGYEWFGRLVLPAKVEAYTVRKE